MHQVKEVIFWISGILILAAAVLYLFVPSIAPWIMAVSVGAFAVVTVTSPYPGKSIRGKRLFNFQLFASIFMIVGTWLMFKSRNEWALAMIIGAVFLLYAAIMIPKELEKERNDLSS